VGRGEETGFQERASPFSRRFVLERKPFVFNVFAWLAEAVRG